MLLFAVNYISTVLTERRAICYEAMQPEQNAKIQQRIYELKALGTMYYSSETIQNYLHDIHFVSKSENMAGLQLADFVPNTLGRYAAQVVDFFE